MNTLTIIAVWLAGSAVLQMIGFYCYSTYQKSRILKSLSYEGITEENATNFNKPGGKSHFSVTRPGGKINVVQPSNNSIGIGYSKLKTDTMLKQVAK